MKRTLAVLGCALVLLVLAGCAKTYLITQPLSQPLASTTTIGVGDIKDELPSDMPADKKPRAEDVRKLKRFLIEEIGDRRIAAVAMEDSSARGYEVRGSLLEYKRGSGAVRFFVGFGLGNAKATVSLKLVDTATGATVFGGNFYGQVSSWAEAGDQTFRKIAKNFAKELQKQLKTAPPRT
jgi:uncharacterized protein DUF4410